MKTLIALLLLMTVAEGEWQCRRCGHYNWSQNTPYTCNNCSCPIGEC